MKRVALLICIVAFSFASCQKNDYTFQKKGGAQQKVEQLYTAVDTTGFASDTLVTDFIKTTTQIKASEVDTAEVRLLTEDDTITADEMPELAQALGFSSLDELNNYLSDTKNLISTLDKKYELKTMDSLEVEQLFERAMVTYLDSLANQIAADSDAASGLASLNIETANEGSNCGSQLAGCCAVIYATSTAEVVACNAADLFPPVAIACVVAVTAMAAAQIDGCYDAYDLCLKNAQKQGASSERYLVSAVKVTFLIR